jgi:hypothetical protein
MSNAARDFTAAERAERAAFLKRLRNLAPKSDATVVPIRKPLGLAPVPGDTDVEPYDDVDLDHGPIIDLDTLDPNLAGAPADRRLVHFCLNLAGSLVDDVRRNAKTLIAEVRSEVRCIELENAKLKATVAALTAKVDSLAFISERLRVENQGPPGGAGPMGRDGHEGRPGARGERGERGAQGPPAPAIIAWEPDRARFMLTPVFSSGERGVPAHLRSLFEAYDQSAAEDDEG